MRINNPKINSIFVLCISVLYSFIFIFTSNHIEFRRILKHSKTLNSVFWNSWTDFIVNGNMLYIGYITIFIAVLIFILTFFRSKKYDEYQVNILSKGLIISGIITILFLPLVLLLMLSDPNYMIEVSFLFLTIQWIGVLLLNLIYLFKYCR